MKICERNVRDVRDARDVSKWETDGCFPLKFYTEVLCMNLYPNVTTNVRKKCFILGQSWVLSQLILQKHYVNFSLLSNEGTA